MQAPSWVEEAKGNYVARRPRSLETNFCRGRLAIETLDDMVLPYISGKLDILIVGAGINALDVKCPAEPYRIGAFLESRGRNYSMHIVDIDQSVIDDIQNRTRVFVCNDEENDLELIEWKNYLSHTNQSDELIHYVVPGLNIRDGIDIERALEVGYKVADIPRRFREGLSSGDITLAPEDIATLQVQRQFDLVSCLNVLYMLSPQGQKLALYNIANAMKKGAVLVTNDMLHNGSPFLSKNGGWLTEQIQQEMGFVKTPLDSSYLADWMVFKKMV